MATKLSLTILVICGVLVKCIPRRADYHSIGGKDKSEHDHTVAFLGQEEKEALEKLTPKQTKARLSEIIDKIDKNNDGSITRAELSSWMEYIQLKHVGDEVDQYWHNYDKDNDGKISWNEFKNTTYGHTDEYDRRSEDRQFRETMEFAKKKWKAADSNHDNSLTKGEFAAFLHPAEYKRMHKVAAEEMFSRIDEDHNGFVSINEYIGDTRLEGSAKKPPEWIEQEKKFFLEERDLDHDKKLNQEEVLKWLFPGDYDPLESETYHLFSKADENMDNILTKQEILNKQEEFIGSQATNFGETLKRPIDEL